MIWYIYIANLKGQPAVASLGEEKFVVVWTSIGEDGDGARNPRPALR